MWHSRGAFTGSVQLFNLYASFQALGRGCRRSCAASFSIKSHLRPRVFVSILLSSQTPEPGIWGEKSRSTPLPPTHLNLGQRQRWEGGSGGLQPAPLYCCWFCLAAAVHPYLLRGREGKLSVIPGK